jgi:hypothetical protein
MRTHYVHNCVPYINAITPYNVSSREVQSMKTVVAIMNEICGVMFQTDDHHVAALTSRTLCTVSVPVKADSHVACCAHAVPMRS